MGLENEMEGEGFGELNCVFEEEVWSEDWNDIVVHYGCAEIIN